MTTWRSVQRLCEINAEVKDLGVNVVIEHGIEARAAKERIRLYLVEYVGEIIDGAELEIVSGISEYARRIRQLRREDGYQIASGASPDADSGIALRPDQYLLIDAVPDQDASRRWHVANRIRKRLGGAQARILLYLQENIAKVVTTEELAYVAKVREFGRRTRELRTQEGYAVATRFTGRPDLKPGQYILQSLDRIAEPHDRHIPEDVQKVVYERDNHACRVCGWSLDRWRSEDPRILELHHIEHHQHGGVNLEHNLIVVCSRCHDEIHVGKHGDLVEQIQESL